ncbi:AraC family transcriptional regulator [Achromobacter xylosoxidans]|uniref:AraC family transcriptional regulator n=1 Tax=Alcaligenes xylosoxydans xylosoxydans TaxID=85698 RepID=UPI0038FCA725
MPVLTNLVDPVQWFDPDLVPRPVVTVGAAGIDLADLDEHGLDRIEKDFHRHRKGQLLLLLRGVLTCEIAGNLWIVPPHSALWVPGDVLHKITAAGTIEVYVAFIEPAAASALPAACCAVTTTAPLRELVVRSASLPLLYPDDGPAAHLVTLLLDELAAAPLGTLQLPMPTDRRLRKIVDALMAEPRERGTMQGWARRVGLSERTLARLLMQQTGMSFGRWRQQLHLMLAVKWLSTGMSVQQVADDLGYESAGGFVTMFRKALGTSPGRYMAQRRPAG